MLGMSLTSQYVGKVGGSLVKGVNTMVTMT
jgi:hypothetical protein